MIRVPEPSVKPTPLPRQGAKRTADRQSSAQDEQRDHIGGIRVACNRWNHKALVHRAFRLWPMQALGPAPEIA